MAVVLLMLLPTSSGATPAVKVLFAPPYASGYGAVTTSSSNTVYGCAAVRSPAGPSFDLSTGRGHWHFVASAHSCTTAKDNEVDFDEGMKIGLAGWSPTVPGTYTARFHLYTDWIFRANSTWANHSAVTTLFASGGLVPYVYLGSSGGNVHAYASFFNASFSDQNGSVYSSGARSEFVNLTFTGARGQIYEFGVSLWFSGQVEAFGAVGNRGVYDVDLGTSTHHFGIPAVTIT